MAEEFQIGDRVDVNGAVATVRYVGYTQFSEGEWVGVELETPDGKNDGTVMGVKYFECENKYGKFFRPSVPRLIERAPQHASRSIAQRLPPRNESAGNIVGTTSPVPQKGARSATSNVAQPASRTGTPTAPARISGIQPSNRASTPARPGSMVLNPQIAPKGTPQPNRRGSQAGLLQTASNTSLGSPRSASATSTSGSRTPVGEAPPTTGPRQPPNRLTVGVKTITAVGALQRKPSTGNMDSGRYSPDGSQGKGLVPQKGHGRKESVKAPPRPSSPGSKNLGPSLPPPSPEAQRSRPLEAANREIEDLKVAIKVLEKKRSDDREKIALGSQYQQERDKYEGIILKLQGKLQPMAEENRDQRKVIKELKAKTEELENEKAEHEGMLEMAMLDKEMAEEQLEYLKSELEMFRNKCEELEVDIEILREENGELSQEMSPEEKTTQGWLQMTKQNERLKDALLRLKEITQQTELELKDNIKSLEEDNENLSQYKEQYEKLQEQLQHSESAVEDLRSQLDAALGAEDMLEDLTEQNMSMKEHIEELRATIEGLESLKEISDELEINHIETEKQMQGELDYKDLIISEQGRRIAHLDATTEEAEYTITKFRDLVVNLQSDLEDMRSSQQLTEAEAEELSARSRSMMDINMKLQLTAAKAQNKTLDLELGRMEAEEATEHLQIVQMFLPEAFSQERDSIFTLLRFKRVSFKAHLLHSTIKERISAQSGVSAAGLEDSFMAACDICDKLTWLAAMCDRFVNCISGCSTTQFAKFRDALHELDPVERSLNRWIESMRKDELKEKQCAEELQRTMAVIAHLGEIYLPDTLESYGQDLQMKVQLMQSNLEGAAATVSHIKYMVSTKFSPTIEEEELANLFGRKAEAIVAHSRSAKVVVGKILRSLNDLRARSLSLTTDTRQPFEQCEEATKKIAAYTRALGEKVADLLYLEEGRTEAVTYAELQSIMYRTTEQFLTMVETDVFGSLSKELRTLTNLLVDLQSTAGDLDMTAEFERAPAPWVVRAQELKNTKIVNIDTEDELRRLKHDIRELVTQVRVKEKSLEEAAVKIELLESRMQKVGNQAEKIETLERHILESSNRESKLESTIESLTSEINSLEKDVSKYKKLANDKRTAGDIDRSGQERAVATAREVAGLKSDIESLRGAVNFLREENARIKQIDLAATNSWLYEPITNPSTASIVPGEMTKGVKEKIWKSEMVREGKDLLSELVHLATDSKIVDLKETPENRNAWRPLATTPSYVYWKQREQYEALAGWRDSIVDRTKKWEAKKIAGGAKGMVGAGKATTTKSGRLHLVSAGEVRKSTAKLQLYNMYPGLEMKRGLAPRVEVVIRESERWDGLRESLGFVAA